MINRYQVRTRVVMKNILADELPSELWNGHGLHGLPGLLSTILCTLTTWRTEVLNGRLHSGPVEDVTAHAIVAVRTHVWRVNFLQHWRAETRRNQNLQPAVEDTINDGELITHRPIWCQARWQWRFRWWPTSHNHLQQLVHVRIRSSGVLHGLGCRGREVHIGLKILSLHIQTKQVKVSRRGVIAHVQWCSGERVS